MKTLLLLYFVIRISTFILRKTYLSEIFLSFTPYIVIFDLIIVLTYSIFFLDIKQNLKILFDFEKKKLTKKKVSFVFFCIISICLFFVTIYDIGKVTKTYTQINIKNNIFQQNYTGLTIFYANIHKNNRTYSGLVDPIQKYNPDVVALVEYENKHHNVLKKFWEENYPYSNRTYIKNYAGNVIFSKYPMEDLAGTVEKKPRRFGYVNIKKHQKKTFLYLVHTSSPGLPNQYKERNKQLEYFEEIVKSQKEINGQNSSIILGDFNLSPWSPFYSDFVNSIGKDWTNVSTAIPLVMTRGPKKVSFPKVHIDHIFISKPKDIISIQKINIGGIQHDGYNGSDHDGFIFQIK